MRHCPTAPVSGSRGYPANLPAGSHGCPESFPSGSHGFTLIELLMTLLIAAVAIVALFAFVAGTRRVWNQQSDLAEAQEEARTALDLITRDLRSAGYAVDHGHSPIQPAFAYASQNEIILAGNLMPYPDTASAHHGAPVAYNPAGSPQPATLTGGYAPSIKYATGAELIRYTLDVNNDGVVNPSDRSDPLAAAEVHRTQDPDAYLLVREVYGDSSGSTPTAGNNGGSPEAVAVLHVPAGRPIFTVYLQNSSVPYDWSNGPVPAAQLDLISRVDIHVSTAARKLDAQGNVRTITLGSTVTEMRNKPQGATSMYVVDGYVYWDSNYDHHFDAPPDSGLHNAVVHLGSSQITRTDSRGYYMFVTSPGVYTLQADAPPGFSKEGADTFTVDLATSPSNRRHDFPDTAVTGGTVVDSVYLDVNGNGVRDPGEPGLANVSIQANHQTVYTDAGGGATQFLPPGNWSMLATGPDTTVATTTNPVTITMGLQTQYATWGFKPIITSYFKGTVFRDANRDGTLNSGEAGMANVWVAVLNGIDGSVVAWQNTDAQGHYVLTVPSNASAHTPPYRLTFAPPNGFYPTTPTSQGPFYIAARDTMGPYNFGANSFTVITLNASNVLSLGTADLIEKDWNGNDGWWNTMSHRDIDLVLGAQHISTSNLSVWFNQYPATPLFDAAPTYTRDATSNVLSIASGSLDNVVPTQRQDVVTGLSYSSSGNFSVWLTQNTSGNLGYVPSTPSRHMTQDMGDVSAVQLGDIGGSSDIDILVGTTTSIDHGSIELWLSSGGATPTFTRDEIWPPSGGVPGGVIGSVKSMVLADLNGDGIKDLVVGTRNSANNGSVLVFQGVSRTRGNRFNLVWKANMSGEVDGVAVADLDLDGHMDIVAGATTGTSTGKISYWHGDGSFNFNQVQSIDAPGCVQALSVADMGGDPNPDIIIGYQGSSGAYTGGTRIYYVATGGLILPTATDPSAGIEPYWTPAITVANFNYGVQPSTPAPPYLMDLATAIKSGSNTGAVVIYVR